MTTPIKPVTPRTNNLVAELASEQTKKSLFHDQHKLADFARQLEIPLNEFCKIHGYPVHQTDTEIEIVVKISAALMHAGQLETELKEAALELTDIPIGNEHETYSLAKRCKIAIELKKFAWRGMDESRAERDRLKAILEERRQFVIKLLQL